MPVYISQQGNLKGKAIYFVILLVCFIYTPTLLANDIPSVKMMSMEQIPNGYKDEEGKNRGVLFDVLNAIIAESVIKNKNEILPINRIMQHFLSNSPACALVANTPELIDITEFIEPIGYSINIGILPKSSIKLEKYDDLKTITIAVPLGVYFDEQFHHDTSIKKMFPSYYSNALKMLKAGRVDAVAGAISNLIFNAKLIGIKEKALGKPYIFSQSEVYIVCNLATSTATKTRLKQAVIKLKAAGKIQAILDRYFK